MYDLIRALHGEQLLDQPLERPRPSRALAGLGTVVLLGRIRIKSNHNKICNNYNLKPPISNTGLPAFQILRSAPKTMFKRAETEVNCSSDPLN